MLNGVKHHYCWDSDSSPGIITIIQLKAGFNEVLLYTTPNGNANVEIYLQNDTVWLTQQNIADLFRFDRSVETKHLAFQDLGYRKAEGIYY